MEIFFLYLQIVPPTWIVEPKDVHTNGKESFRLECKADGSPKPTIKWITSKGLLDSQIFSSIPDNHHL